MQFGFAYIGASCGCGCVTHFVFAFWFFSFIYVFIYKNFICMHYPRGDLALTVRFYLCVGVPCLLSIPGAGHLSCFQVLAVVGNAVMNSFTCVLSCVCTRVLGAMHLVVELQGLGICNLHLHLINYIIVSCCITNYYDI